ncbi:ATP-binding protein [Blautia producta]|uniref:ATP-binding protein n=1 Tax=Blautia producta TaxID=33035 RepID=UPI0031B57962
MSYSTYIGQIMGGKNVKISVNSPNQHIVISGISGSGKSVRIADIEKNIIKDGGTIIEIDINGTSKPVTNVASQRISAFEDGLNVSLLDTSQINLGRETKSNLIQYVLETICPRQMHGTCQRAAVHRAIEYAIQNRYEYSSEMEALAAGLKLQNDVSAQGAFDHLCPILEGNIFRSSTKYIKNGVINNISLQGFNSKTQKRIVEIFLNAMWRKIRTDKIYNRKWTLVVDEFQNLDVSGSVLFQMLTEGRKYGLNLILATQTLTIFSKKELSIINQAASKLFFRQGRTDLRVVSALIDSTNKEKWMETLSNLRVGQAIVTGELEIGSKPIMRPILTYSSNSQI